MSVTLLRSRVIALSVSKAWDEARTEWRLEDITKAQAPSSCLCGHRPIFEICTLRNTKNEAHAVVGNCCVRKFIGLPSGKIFQAISRVQKDWWRALNSETLEYAFEKGWINDSEKAFYYATMRKRLAGLTKDENIMRDEINRRVLRHVVKPN